MREGEAEEVILVEGYTDRMASGSRMPSSFNFIAVVITKFPPAESPINMIRSPVVPMYVEQKNNKHFYYLHYNNLFANINTY